MNGLYNMYTGKYTKEFLKSLFEIENYGIIITLFKNNLKRMFNYLQDFFQILLNPEETKNIINV